MTKNPASKKKVAPKKKVARKNAPAKKAAPKKPDILSPEVAQKLLEADMARILQKVRDKKPLTAPERNLLQQRAAGGVGEGEVVEQTPDHVSSIAALCGVLGIDRKTYYNWKKKFSNEIPANRTNGSYDVAAWREFIRRKGLIEGFDSTDDEEDGEDLDALKRRDLKAKAREREFKLEILKKEYLHKDDVREAVTSLVQETIKLIRDKLENELPPVCAGLDAVRIRQENSRVIDEVCEILHQGGDIGGEGDDE